MEPYNQTRWRMQVSNGQIPAHLLETIEPPDYDADLGGPAKMHPEATWNYERMRAAARADGVALLISYSYRTLAVQVVKYRDYLAGGNLAARPGTSNHGWGTALDLAIPAYPAANNSAAFRWLKANAARFGYHNNDAPSEPWHWDYEGGHPIEEDDEDMGYAEFKKGVQRRVDGKELGTDPDPDEAFGWRMEDRARSLPKPADHEHDPGEGLPAHKHVVTGEAV